MGDGQISIVMGVFIFIVVYFGTVAYLLYISDWRVIMANVKNLWIKPKYDKRQ